MTSVAVLEKDQVLRSLVVRELALRGYDVASFASQEDAIERARSGAVDILVSRLHGDEEGWGLLSALNEKVPHVRPIMMAGEDVWSQSSRAQELGAVEVLPYPLVEGQLVDAVERAESSCVGFSGWVHGVSLIDLLQIFHYGRRTVGLSIERKGVLQFVEGEIVDAQFGELIGEEAVRAILHLEGGRIRTFEGTPRASTVERTFQSLLLDCLRELDEDARDQSSPDNEEQAAVGSPSIGEVSQSIRPSFLPGHNPHEEMLGGVCRDVMAHVDGAQAAAFLQLDGARIVASEGMELGAEQALATVVRRLMRAPSVTALEECSVGEVGAGAPEELRLATESHRYFVRRVPGRDLALVLVADKEAAGAFCWAALRQAVKTSERILP